MRIFVAKFLDTMLQIRCKNNNVTKSFPEGTSLLDIYQEFADEIKLPYPVVSAKVNNASQGLKFRVERLLLLQMEQQALQLLPLQSEVLQSEALQF